MYVDSTDGAKPVLLRNIEVDADDLSPDGTKVLATRRAIPELVVLPVKAGPQAVSNTTSRATTAPIGFRTINASSSPARVAGTGVCARSFRICEEVRRSRSLQTASGRSRSMGKAGAPQLSEMHKTASRSGRSRPGHHDWCPVPERETGLSLGAQMVERCGYTAERNRRSESSGSTLRPGDRQIWKTLGPSDVTGVVLNNGVCDHTFRQYLFLQLPAAAFAAVSGSRAQVT